jgi:uncharacterized membrane protein
VPLLAEKNEPEIQWHAKHGIVLMVAEVVLLLGFAMITSLASLATLGLGCVLSMLLVFIWVGILVVHAAAIIMGIHGNRFVIPGISDYANRF